MGSLGDFFSEEKKKEFAQGKIKAGTVIKTFVTNTVPPKIKRCLIIAQSSDNICVGVVLFNSEINWNVQRNMELASLQYMVRQDENSEILDKDSYVDCSQLIEFDISQLITTLTSEPETFKA